MNQTWVGRGALILSAAVHAYAFLKTPAVKTLSPPPSAQAVDLYVPPPLPEEVILPEPAPEPEPEPEVTVEPEPEVTPTEPEPAPETEAPLDSEPQASEPELTGTTLVAEGEGEFSAERGSGASRTGPVVSGTSTPTKTTRKSPPKGPSKPAPKSPPALPLSQLSRRPVPPPLGGALKRNYPKTARDLGLSGEAKVRARIEPSGAVVLAKVQLESASGFGDACRKTIVGSTWSAPRDKEGHPVATWVTYSCKFRIED